LSSKKILIGKEAIKAHIGVTTDHVVDTLVRIGLPVTFINGRWFSSVDALDRWMTEFFIANRGKTIDTRNGAELPRDHELSSL